VDAPLGGGHDHFAMLVEPTRANAHNVGFRLVQQLAVIGKRLGRAKSLGGLSATRVIRVGNAHYFHFGHLKPNNIKTVAIITAARVTDDTHPVLGWHVGAPWLRFNCFG
jgi:hypothetical protein